MLEYLKTYLVFGTRFCGIEHTSKNGQTALYTTVLSKKKKKVDLENYFHETSIKSVSEKLKKNQHATLIINNEQVLTKSINSKQSEGENLVNIAFPNINISDFYYEITLQNAIRFVSISRKNYIDNLLKNYSDNGIYVLTFSLGNSIISSSFNYIESSRIYTSNALIVKNKQFIESIKFEDKIEEALYNVNGLETSSQYILPLSASLSNILNNYNPITNFKVQNNALTNTFFQLRFFNQFIKIGLFFILSILLINFMFFNYYFNEVKTLNETSQINQTTKTKIVKLNEDVNRVKKMTDDMLKSSISKSSFYVNEIIQNLPNSILLSEINYQPLIKRINKDKIIEQANNIITVSGDSNDSTIYSEWITFLESKDWINKVDVEEYSDRKSKYSFFSIKIHIIP